LTEKGLDDYSIYDFAPEYDEGKGLALKYLHRLSTGTKADMQLIMGNGSKVLNVIAEVVWDGPSTVFGPVVSLHCYHLILCYTEFSLLI
jgi:hypothetical protein